MTNMINMKISSLKLALLTAAVMPTLWAAQVTAQVNVERLNPARAYDSALPSENGAGLGADLWQGTNAKDASRLISAIGTRTNQGADMLIDAALYSGGEPPFSADGTGSAYYNAARLNAFLKRGNFEAFDLFTEQANLHRTNPVYKKIFVERSLLSGDTSSACQQTDALTVERKAPYWAKLRAFCHQQRGEDPAAELTMDLLRRAGHKDDGFFSLMNALVSPAKTNFKDGIVTSPLHIAMARTLYQKRQINPAILPALLAKDIAMDDEAAAEIRLAAMRRSAYFLSDNEIWHILGALEEIPTFNVGALPKTAWSAKNWGGAYKALKSSRDIESSAALTTAILRQAELQGIFTPIARALTQDITLLPPSLRAISDPVLYAKIAIAHQDNAALRAIFESLSDSDARKGRIALAADAVGGGFFSSALGTDIENRLRPTSTDRARAVRDAHIAVALGAALSQAAAKNIDASIDTATGAPANSGDLLGLRAAASRGAKAETALRAAHILSETPINALSTDSLTAIIFALRQVGLDDFASQLAAQDFLSTSAP